MARAAGIGGNFGRERTTLHAWLMLAPAMTLLVAFTHYPALATIWHSFFSTPKGARPARFVGAENYAVLAEDPVFWLVLKNNLIYALGTVPLSIGIALAMALWVNGRIRGKAAMRMAYFVPTVLPMIAVANLWLFFYTPDYGLIDRVTRLLFGWGPTNWIGSQETALGAMMVVAIWKEAGFFMIFYLAALQQISPTLIEAARLEGATPLQTFRRVTAPLIMPTTLFVLVNALIGAFRLVDHVIALTKGGPDNATTLLLFYIYETGFQYWDTGYAAALTVFLLTVLALIALFQFGYLDKKVHYR